ncbi:MAG TPA: hypothetical protein VHY84_22465 [Bryobacteraceae bacterium]|jgi:hypothetical protein|nr:hypothetical protein [Bryobacteraceae bacterium]
MNLQLNHLNSKAAAVTPIVVETLHKLMEAGDLDQAQFARLQVQLDWIQYKQNFREMVTVANIVGRGSRPIDMRIDARQVTPENLHAEMLRAIGAASDPEKSAQDRIPLEDFKSFRHSMAWEFNKLYWSQLGEWEKMTGKGYQEALPGGKSDGNQEEAVMDSVADFWTLLRDMETRKQLPAEIFILEIGVGSGTRCGMFVEKFRQLDQQRGTSYYPRLRVLMGDYSLETLDMSRPAVKEHLHLCSFLALDALNPLKTLSFLRHKILYIHSTNMYDNLPDEEILRRDGKLSYVHARMYLPMRDAVKIAEKFKVQVENIRGMVEKLLAIGPDFAGERACGMSFWQEFWKAVRLEEKIVALEEMPDLMLPTGLDVPRLEDILARVPGDLRFHLSSGALESFVNTIPLLHPRGYLQVQDIFVTDLNEYRVGFHGPGKLDGSIVNWVNGALLKGVAERTGYDLHFAPYRYRRESKTSVLYTTPRE